ncbi:MAG: phospholipid carrier-dependent glycosyltransferase [Anaerolineae bacterium]|nr:phospholipid carrier-dependent glycosyltransferase [Anaerolineae bacterium]
MLKISSVKTHGTFLIVLLIHIILALAYSISIPLGEAPDEPAHITYARYIADKGLPNSLAARREAGYRSTWPPLYHFLIAGPITAVGDAVPTRLKAVGDSPRRLIPTNGQTIASFIHTEDEAWPWRGITLAWHLGRFISVSLAVGTITLTYLIGLQLTGSRTLATGAAALQSFLPQFLFIGGVVNDDTLLIFLSSLVFFVLIVYTTKHTFPSLGQLFLVGTLLGLAIVAKYNALPLWGVVAVWFIGLIVMHSQGTDLPRPLLSTTTRRAIPGAMALLTGTALTGGWWFFFVWRNFNQISSQGLIAGSLAALSAGTSDASLRQISDTSGIAWPNLTMWIDWVTTLFQSFWGLFGGGGTIALPDWLYLLLAIISLLALSSLLFTFATNPLTPKPLTAIETPQTPQTPQTLLTPQTLFLLIPLFYLPLPILRFILSGSIIETAQGRHLFPALSLIMLALALGLSRFALHARRDSASASKYLIAIVAAAFLAISLYALYHIRTSYPPLIPLRTTEATPIEHSFDTTLAEGIDLIGYQLDPIAEGMLPITLLWQATDIPPEDYLIQLTLTDPDDGVIGSWLGHPIGGRYPTRAWDEGDIIRDTLLLPLLSTSSDMKATLTLTLLDTANQPTSQPFTLASNLSLAPLPNRPLPPTELRTDGLPSTSPFTYRSTLSFAIPDLTTPPQLLAPDGQSFTPDAVTTTSTGTIAHFIVAANWPSGDYQLTTPPLTATANAQPDFAILHSPFSIRNRPRQFTPPPMAIPLDANFDNRITILGVDLPQRRVNPGDSFPITLHMQAERTMGRHLSLFNHLLDSGLTQRGGVDRIPQNFYTTLLWVPGEIVSDAYDVPVDTDAPPGIYWLDVGFYPTDKPAASLPLVVDGTPIDRTGVMIGPLKVGGPPPQLTTANPQPQTPLDITFGDQITLLGYTLTAENFKPLANQDQHPHSTNSTNSTNSQNSLTLYWHANTTPPADYTVFLHFINSTSELIAQADAPPAAGAYPTSLWDTGETIIDTRPLPDLPPGQYTLHLGLYNPTTGQRLPVPNTPDNAITLLEFEMTP